MKINDFSKKPRWKRRLPNDERGGIQWQYLTQDDFMDELHPTAHKINSNKYKSMRPKYRINKDTGKSEIVGYDDVERVAWALEKMCLRTCTTHCAGGDVWFGNEGSEADGEIITEFKSHWNMSGMRHALQAWLHDAFACGDSAVYLYRENGKVKYRVFSYLNGDTVYKPAKNVFIRKFEAEGTVLIEVYDDKNVSTYMQNASKEKLDEIGYVLGRDFSIGLGVSEDGWHKIEEVLHGSIGMPVSYLRLDDVVWGSGVSIRERIEKIVSAWGDNNNYFAFPIFTFSGKAQKLPDMGAVGKAIGFTNSDGRAGILSPPDASTSFLQDLEKNLKAWADACGITMIDPKDLKGGAEASGAYLRNLYFTSVIWAQLKLTQLRPDIDGVIDVFLRQVGVIEGNVKKYREVKMSWILEPFVPTNKMEDITIVTQCVNAGITSIETGAEEIAHNNPFEMERLRRQKLEVLQDEAIKREEITTGGEKPEGELPRDNTEKGVVPEK